jgi:hypothetical protein
MIMNKKNIKIKIALVLVLTMLFWVIGPGLIFASEDGLESNDDPLQTSGFFGKLLGFFQAFFGSLKSIFITDGLVVLSEEENGKGFQETDLQEDKSKKGDKDKIEKSVDKEKKDEQGGKFGEKISGLAQGLKTGETSVDELVEAATSIHLEVLEEVLGKVPEQAKAAIENAKENSKKGVSNAVDILGGHEIDQSKEENQVNGPPEHAKQAKDNNPSKKARAK